MKSFGYKSRWLAYLETVKAAAHWHDFYHGDVSVCGSWNRTVTRALMDAAMEALSIQRACYSGIEHVEPGIEPRIVLARCHRERRVGHSIVGATF